MFGFISPKKKIPKVYTSIFSLLLPTFGPFCHISKKNCKLMSLNHTEVVDIIRQGRCTLLSAVQQPFGLRRLSVGARKGWKESPYYHPEKWTKAHVPTINFHGINRYSFQRGGVYNSFLEKEAIEILGDFVGWVLHLGSLKFWKAWKQLLGWLVAVPTSPKRLDKWNPLEVNLAQTAGVSLDLHGLKWNMN